MKRKLLIAALLVTGLAVVTLVLTRRNQTPAGAGRRAPVQGQAAALRQGSAARVPAHYEMAPGASLAPTLPPERFTGLTRDAYRAVREIPQTIAQMPCYCHCDEGFGHKSLQSCFADDHAAHCAVCVNEALTAYRLQKEQGLNAQQIRERIIAEYSRL